MATGLTVIGAAVIVTLKTKLEVICKVSVTVTVSVHTPTFGLAIVNIAVPALVAVEVSREIPVGFAAADPLNADVRTNVFAPVPSVAVMVIVDADAPYCFVTEFAVALSVMLTAGRIVSVPATKLNGVAYPVAYPVVKFRVAAVGVTV